MKQNQSSEPVIQELITADEVSEMLNSFEEAVKESAKEIVWADCAGYKREWITMIHIDNDPKLKLYAYQKDLYKVARKL